MAAHREVISLQFGHFSNFIGTHWWNIQEQGFDYTSSSPSEINHDVLFREGETLQGQVTFTPRMLLVDLKGSLGTLPEHGGLYENSLEQQEPVWLNQVDVIRKEKCKNNEFLADLEVEEKTGQPIPQTKQYKLDDCVDVWSDFLRTRYHPRTINIVNEYERGDISTFCAYPQGTTLWKSDYFEEHFVDGIRKYAEECDNLQGFQVLVDSINGFGGLACASTQFLADEFSSKSIFTISVGHGSYPERVASKEMLRVANVALCLQNLALHSTMMAPLSTSRGFWQQDAVPRLFSNLDYKSDLPYHTSSIIAATLECCTLPYRVRQGQGLGDLEHTLVLGGRKAVAASVSFPFPMDDKSNLLNVLEEWEGPLLQGMSACCDLDHDRVWSQAISIRGVPLSKLKGSDAPTNNSNPAFTSKKVDEMLQYFLQCTSPETKSHVTSVTLPCNVSAPFPNFFSPVVGHNGYLVPEDQPNETGVRSVPMIAGLHSSRSVGAMLESLQGQAAHCQWRNLPQLAEAGLERDEFNESLEHLLQFAECYNEEFEV